MTKSIFPRPHRLVLLSLLGLMGCYSSEASESFADKAVAIDWVDPPCAVPGSEAGYIEGNGFGAENVTITVGGIEAEVLAATGMDASFVVPAEGLSPGDEIEVVVENPGGRLATIDWRVCETARLTGIGLFEGDRTAALDVSGNGNVVAALSSPSSTMSTALLWRDGVLESLPPLFPEILLTSVVGASFDGSILVGSTRYDTSPGVGATEAVLWDNGVISPLGDLPGGGFHSEALAVSADGSVVVGRCDEALFFHNVACRWVDRGAPEALLSGGSPIVDARATGISDDKTIIVGTVVINAVWRGFVLQNGVRSLLDQSDQAFRVSADGSVVVGTSLNHLGDEVASRWVNQGPLERIAPLEERSWARDVSADGSVIVGQLASGRAFRWTEVDGLQLIEDLLIAEGVDLGSWNLINATGISDDGRTIVGTGSNAGVEGWIAILPLPLD